jgi:putative transposase
MKKEKSAIIKAEPPSGFDYESFEKAAIKGLSEGRDLVGKDGVLTGLIQRIVNAALEGELDGHLASRRKAGGKNRRNGHTSKNLDTSLGTVGITPPRDREGSFSPQIVGKWNRQLGTGLDEQILSLYSTGNSVSDIQHQLRQIYGLEYSAGSISMITDRVMDELLDWQQRPLASLYVIIYLDAIHFKIRENGQVQTQAIYTVFGVDVNGNRDILGLYLGDQEGAHQWGRILEDIQKRGVEEVLFFCVDGLKGFHEAIMQVYPLSFVQRCIIHMIRTSVRFVGYVDIKKVCADLRKMYSAADINQAEIALDVFEQNWSKKYKEIAPAWRANWTELMTSMQFGKDIRRIIYTTNAVEALHRQMRKATKTKGAWVNSKGLLKQLYLNLKFQSKGWKRNVFNWVAIQRELIDVFGNRYTKHQQ